MTLGQLMGCMAVLGLLLSLAALWVIHFRTLIRVDFSRLPPDEALRRVLRRRVPFGVSRIQAAGETWLVGANVWVRLEATPEAIASLTEGTERISPEWIREPSVDPVYQPPEIRARIRRVLRWDDVYGLQHPEAYHVWSTPGAHTHVLVDRRRHTVYAFYWGQ